MRWRTAVGKWTVVKSMIWPARGFILTYVRGEMQPFLYGRGCNQLIIQKFKWQNRTRNKLRSAM